MLCVILLGVSVKFHRLRTQFTKDAIGFRTSFMKKSQVSVVNNNMSWTVGGGGDDWKTDNQSKPTDSIAGADMRRA
jgi:hypothetical protein